MELEQISLPVKNTLLADYWAQHSPIHSFFTYRYEQASFEQRIQKLRHATYQNEQLSQVIRAYMESYGLSPKSEQHLQELENGAVAVVGGQQAGVLTGPLYSVHKAISVLKLAQEQRELLKTPVVPIFWIAGEDHDLEEINHTYTIVDGQVKKRGYGKRSAKKTMASATEIDQAEMAKFIQAVFKDFGETAYTQQLLKKVSAAAENSQTFTEFFTYLMHDLFNEYGLLMIDAAYAPFRQLESAYFEHLIRHSEEIAHVVVKQEEALSAAGYGKPLEASADNANLFYVEDGERFLLQRHEQNFSNVQGRVKLNQEELLALAKQSPEKISNNVVTRPLMQEMTIPVLAFVGGPGELAYWATLKGAFEVLDLEMPIFAPRLHITLMPRQIERYLNKYELTVEQAVQGQAQEKLEQFIASVQEVSALEQIEQMQQALLEQYDVLAQHLEENDLHLEQTIEKNKAYHAQQLAYLTNKVKEQTLQKHDVAIRRFNMVQAHINPNAGLQERVYSPYLYMNEYGEHFISDLMRLKLEINNRHNVVKY